ncbi:MAG: ECF-type sigma factor, partial [Planctomycetota bacterium]
MNTSLPLFGGPASNCWSVNYPRLRARQVDSQFGLKLDRGNAMTEVTQLLSQMARGEKQAADQLLPLVYDELRRLAAIRVADEKPGQTIQATALVH